MALVTDSAFAERRVALVVGNSTYQSVPQLPNPSRDASSVAKMFRDAGFDTVETLINVGNLEFKRAIRKFEATADQADIAVVYYAGHGLEIGG
ncbi:caspase family protein, partial [Acinetobacter baumannii]